MANISPAVRSVVGAVDPQPVVSYDRHVDRGWIVEGVRRLPAGALSRAWGALMRHRRPRLAVSLAKQLFVALNRIDLSEASEPMAAYDSLEALFVRRLRKGARPIDAAPDAVVSPVDGTVGMCGTVERGTLLQVKGRSYPLAKLLGDERAAARAEGGAYATIYLAPKNYHRVHAPLAGEVSAATIIPGRLLPVFAEAIERIDELFARNERLVTYLDTQAAGCLAVVMVGATFVGRMGVVYDETARTNVAGGGLRRMRYERPYALGKGDELGVFEFGSTVVLIAEPGAVRFDGVEPGQAVRMGMRIGTVGSTSRERGPSNARPARQGKKDGKASGRGGTGRAGGKGSRAKSSRRSGKSGVRS